MLKSYLQQRPAVIPSVLSPIAEYGFQAIW